MVGVQWISDSGSDLTKLVEAVNVEVVLSSVDKHIKCFGEDENCDGIVAELNPKHESDEESENEDVQDNAEAVSYTHLDVYKRQVSHSLCRA